MGTTEEIYIEPYQIFCTEEIINSVKILKFGILYKNERGEVIKKVEDISTEREFVERLTETLNEENVEVCHLENIVEDAIY